ncbi:Nitroreductase [Filimonas lacunae]|uniref:Putative NAD(P)H nitroreductase n=2 Tax=Filimonas lacunae TaxID=477680 RepID=A0A1N7LZM7_9BACT|nr:Nitroreductase [Filimonas lacunae]
MATLTQIIENRRSIKPAVMNGQKIEDNVIRELLQLADWAPTHAKTEPWRFVVYAGEAVARFCADHANLYKENTPAERFNQGTFDNLTNMGNNLSHIVAVYMKRGANPNIPVIEELAATSCAVQNILLGAEANGIAVLWSTGGMTLKPAMKQYFQLEEEDAVLGLLYMGYAADSSKPGARNTPLEQKVQWHS